MIDSILRISLLVKPSLETNSIDGSNQNLALFFCFEDMDMLSSLFIGKDFESISIFPSENRTHLTFFPALLFRGAPYRS